MSRTISRKVATRIRYEIENHQAEIRLARLRARPNVRIGERARLEGRPTIDVAGLTVGDDFLLWSHEATTLLAGTGMLTIGDRSFVNSGARIFANGRVEIGDDVLIGVDAIVTDSNMHGQEGRPDRPRPTIIGSGTWIAMRAMVMPGVRVGERCIVAAGAIVTVDVPDGTLVAGVPARIVRSLDLEPGARRAWNNESTAH
jgi:acetyltransferase-like isoleucine patch superfamily enzyme